MTFNLEHIPYDEQSKALLEDFKNLYRNIHTVTVTSLRDSRSKSLLLTHLEESYMWVGKAIRDDQLAREGVVDEI